MPLKEDLTNEELAVMARKKDPEAMEQLIKQNQGLVITMAYGFLKSAGFGDCIQTGLVEDYEQICRMAISKAVKNYRVSAGVKFITYAGRIMRNDMLKEIKKESEYRFNSEIMEKPVKEKDAPAQEEVHEEYGDSYDNSFEDRRVIGKEAFFDYRLPSERRYADPEQLETVHGITADEAAEKKIIWFHKYTTMVKNIEKAGEDPEENEGKDESQPKERHDVIRSKTDRNYSWENPVCYQAIKNVRIEAMLKWLMSEFFLQSEREYLIYRFGLIDQKPKKLTETMEHFHLSKSAAMKKEKEGLEHLAARLRYLKLM